MKRSRSTGQAWERKVLDNRGAIILYYGGIMIAYRLQMIIFAEN